jgi:uncharacterized protein (UPF0276 family)
MSRLPPPSTNHGHGAPLFPLLGFGVGLRAVHYDDILAGPRRIDWFEALTENYIDTGGRPLHVLERVRQDYPVALHGVALSIGSADPLNPHYLRKLRELVRRLEPALVTDHLCWTAVDGRALYDLLPLPYTEATLEHVVTRVRKVQDWLGRRILLENPSTYIQFRHSVFTEWDFLAAVAEQADCGILLDVNNVHVSATNHGFDARRYIDSMPPARVAQVHLAGFTDMGTYLFDTHSAPVSDAVWRLYAHAVRRCGPVSTLVEWDQDIPGFDRLCAEAEQARSIAEGIDGHRTRVYADAARAAAVDGRGNPGQHAADLRSASL